MALYTKNYRGVNFILVRPDSKILLQQRDNGEWCFPGGRVEERETALEAAIRECQEETGVNLSASQVCPFQEFVWQRDNQSFTNLIYICFVGFEQVKIGEGRDMRWVSWQDTQSMKLVFNEENLFPAIWFCVQQVRASP